MPCRARMSLWLGALLIAAAPCWPATQNLELHLPASPSDPKMPEIMKDLADRVLPVYEEPDRQRYLATLSALQLVDGNTQAALSTRQDLRNLRKGADPTYPADRSVAYDIYARARNVQAHDKVAFDKAFVQSYRDMVPQLSDKDAYAIISQLETPPAVSRNALLRLMERDRANKSVGLSEAVELVWAYVSYEAYRGIGPLIGKLAAEDDARRYIVEPNVLIKTADGASISATLVRPRTENKPLPTLLEFTIYVYPVNDAKECAAHGYVGIVAYARGKRGSTDQIEPFAHDGDDARSVIDWVTKQSWSDGRVGMYGTAYSGYAAWAAAKDPPAALKAIMTSTPTAPGIDAPKEGNIYHNSAYRWARYVTDTRGLNSAIYTNDAHWRALDDTWYREGESYWDLMHVYKRNQPDFRRWLGHPSYDPFWQRMIPFEEDFARINIPILTTSGYYDGAEAGALYYFNEHYRHNPKADQTLLIGPYDHGVVQRGPSFDLYGYQVDSSALINLRELRYDWFNYVLLGAAKPPLLQDRVNFEVMGANEWQHAPSIDAMGTGSLKLFWTPATPPTDDKTTAPTNGSLTAQAADNAAFTLQSVDLADRSDAAYLPPFAIAGRHDIPVHNAIVFESDAMSKPTQISGALGGQLDFVPNKQDLDITLALYEKLQSGEYIALFDPAYAFRASYAADRVHRHLLRANERQTLAFHAERVTSRQLAAGSRLVLVVGINKRPDQQINYGTDADVSDGTLADASTPVEVQWYGTSYIELPTRQQ
jgi:putative CocE/NonD family hydrolase